MLYEIDFWQATCKIVEQKGWVLQRITGSHHIYENPELEKILSIPVHRNQDLKVGTLEALMKIAQLSEEDLLYISNYCSDSSSNLLGSPG
ncbi:type II toxin-antitoxin system HicA family toxin [Nostoc sp.]|uniref:type II toxin-antitoxin system HicA family toxin n=1 Tax=Nostoc sp. TaxID=1180 RepID=UPI002FF9BC38